MEIQLHQKVHLVVVSNVLFFLVLLFLPSQSEAQKLSGNYISSSLDGIGSSRRINFKNGRFTDLTTQEGEETRGAGTYLVKSDKLIFNYEKIINKDSSVYSITPANLPNRAKIQDRFASFIYVKLFDENNIATFGSVTIKDTNEDVISVFSTDKIGYLEALIFRHKIIGYVEISKIGYDKVLIPIEMLKDDSNIEVHFKVNTNLYYIRPKKMVYKIIRNTSNELKIISENGEEIFKRMPE